MKDSGTEHHHDDSVQTPATVALPEADTSLTARIEALHLAVAEARQDITDLRTTTGALGDRGDAIAARITTAVELLRLDVVAINDVQTDTRRTDLQHIAARIDDLGTAATRLRDEVAQVGALVDQRTASRRRTSRPPGSSSLANYVSGALGILSALIAAAITIYLFARGR